MSDKCTLDGNLINRCDMLAKAIEYGNPSYRSKGAFIPERLNFNTGKPAIDIAQLHSGEYVGHSLPDGAHELYAAPQPLTDAERIELQQSRRILAGLPQVAIDRGWTAAGASAHARCLEDELAAKDAELQQYRIAASEAVAWLWSHRKHKSEVTLTRPEDDERAESALWSGWTCQPLAPVRPAPVVPDVVSWEDVPEEITEDDIALASAWAHGFNQCRAAVLQGEPTDDERIMAIEGIIPAADEHVRYESNAGGNLWVQCSKQKYEKMKLAGMLTRVLYERPQNAQQNIPENIPVNMPCKLRDAVDTIRNSSIAIDGEKILAERDALNSPVIPDGWVMLPAEPTQAMMNAWLSEVANWRGHAAGYRAMIAAAPQQEP